jgi:hypothetical protein
MLLFQSHAGPQQKVKCARRRTAIPVNRHGAQHTPVVRSPFTFGRNLRPGFETFPRARAGPRAAVVEDEGVDLPGALFRLSKLGSYSQILATWPMAASSPPMSRSTCQVPPMLSCCTRRQLESSHCRPRSGLLTWHLSASTADSLLYTVQFGMIYLYFLLFFKGTLNEILSLCFFNFTLIL